MLHILHVNDSEADCFDNWPYLATAIGALLEAGRCDLLLHAGDVSLATVVADAKMSIMNSLGFDAMVPGNHDFDHGIEALQKRLEGLDAAVLCANVTGPAAGCFQPYYLLRRAGLTVAVCGVTLPHMALLQPERHLTGLTFHPPAPALIDLIPSMRRTADLVIVLSHGGYELDRELATIPGVDLVVGGHSHHLLREPVRVADAWVAQAGEQGVHVGWMTARRNGERWEITGGVHPTAGLDPDPAALALAPATRDGDDAIIGYTATDLRSPDDACETPLGNFTADLIRTYADADVALLRCVSVGNVFPPGPIRRRDLARLNDCGLDRIARLEATGAEIVEALECGASEAYFLLTTSGVRVVYDAHRPAGRRVAITERQGVPLDLHRRYRVAYSEILAKGASVFEVFRGKPYTLMPETLEELLARTIAAQDCISPALDRRLVIRGVLPTRRGD